MNVFGLNLNNDIVEPDMTVEYGFAYYDAKDAFWRYYSGNFLYLFGIMIAFGEVESQEAQIYDDKASTFLYLDVNKQPTRLINNIRITEELAPHIGRETGTVFRDLTQVRGNPPPMRFDV